MRRTDGTKATNERPHHTWEEFKSALVRRFGPTALEDANIAIKLLQQTGSVSTYQAAFEDLQSRIPTCPEPLLIGLYVGGLQRRILLQVQVWKPQSLQDAYALARHFEAALHDPAERLRRRPPWHGNLTMLLQPMGSPPSLLIQRRWSLASLMYLRVNGYLRQSCVSGLIKAYAGIVMKSIHRDIAAAPASIASQVTRNRMMNSRIAFPTRTYRASRAASP